MMDAEQNALILALYGEIVPISIAYRNKGLTPANRASAYLTVALSIADIEFQETEGRTLNEDEFAMLARVVYRKVHEHLEKGALS